MKQWKIIHIATSDMAIKCLLANQLRSFCRLGYQVWAASMPGPFADQLVRERFGYIPVPLLREISPVRDLYSLVRVTRLLRAGSFDLVHTHTNKAGILGCWAGALAGARRVVFTVHGFYFHELMPPTSRRFFVEIYRSAFARADRVLFQSGEDLETALSLRLLSRPKALAIGNGIDLSRFDPDHRPLQGAARELRRELGIGDEVVLIGIVARINREKGVKELIEALAVLKAKGLDRVAVVVVGDGPAGEEYRSLAERLGLKGSIFFVGFREDVPAWMKAIDIFALPSYREGYPRTICEAFAMGKPVVATRIRGCRELIEEGRRGFLVPVKDSSALADALERLATDRSLAAAMGAEARAYARLHLDEDRVIARIASVYSDLGVPPPLGHPFEPPSKRKGEEHVALVT